MSRVADTFYFLALLNRNDDAHAAATRACSSETRLVTTEWVLGPVPSETGQGLVPDGLYVECTSAALPRR
jgi:hypothetical protein